MTRIVSQPDRLVPFDGTASGVLGGERLFVTNRAMNARNSLGFAVRDVFAAEPGQPLFEPRIAAGGRQNNREFRAGHGTGRRPGWGDGPSPTAIRSPIEGW